jgi:hypothetical protein
MGQNLHETTGETPMAFVHAHCLQTVQTTANENATNVAADQKMWIS